ncbi:MAG TPA: hypothetical protein V6D25_06350 [Leptolyngbyaceae cyanobacterium]
MLSSAPLLPRSASEVPAYVTSCSSAPSSPSSPSSSQSPVPNPQSPVP